jgi:peroxiredoxin Q/BCP
MAQLRQDYDEFVKRDAEVLVIGPEDEVAFVRYWEKESLPFVGLPDPEHTVLRLYGQEIKLFKMGRMPAQVIVDRQGQARYVHYGHEISEIPPNEELLALLGGLSRGSTFCSGSARPRITGCARPTHPAAELKAQILGRGQ